MEDELKKLEKELESYRKKFIKNEEIPPVIISKPSYELTRPEALKKRIIPPFDGLAERGRIIIASCKRSERRKI